MRFTQLLPSLKLLNGSFVVILPKGTSDVVVSERSVQNGSLCPTTKAFEGFRFAAACPASGMGRAGSLTSPGGGGLRGGGWKGWDLRWSSLRSPYQGHKAGAGDTLKKTTRPGKGYSPLLISWSEVEESIVAALCSAPGTRAVSRFICYPARGVKCSGLLTVFVAYLDHLT